MAEFDITKFDIKNNICIEASAGTGKTHTVQLIVEELLKLKPAHSLEEILIVTYTEKAAGELRDRIRSKILETLVDLKDKKTKGEELNQKTDKYLSLDEQINNFEKQISLVDNAPIYTIHSFCQQTLGEFGFAAKQCDDMDMLDENEAEAFVEKWLRDKMAYDDVFTLFMERKSDDDEINLKAYVSALKKYYLNSQGNEEADIVTLDRTTPQQKIDEIKRFSADEILEIRSSVVGKSHSYFFDVKKIKTIEKLARKINDSTNEKVSVTDEENQKSYEEFVSKVMETKKQLDKIGKNTKTLATAKDDNNELIKSLEQVEKIGYSTRESACTKYFNDAYINPDLSKYFNDLKTNIKIVAGAQICDLKPLQTLLFEQQVPELYKAWIKYKSDNKKQDFDDMIRNVREAVCESDSELLKKLKDKYKYAIIDEFQDTNQKQWDIFKCIFMKYDETSKKCTKDDNHAICVVGDPKQSIYAFQGADVNVYSSAIEDIKNSNSDEVKKDLPYNLDRNFRSTNSMIDACNALFENNGDSDFFKGNTFTFADSHHPDYNHSDCVKLVKPDAEFDGTKVQPFWIPAIKDQNQNLISKQLDEGDFAKFASQQIIECCTFNDSGSTRLQVYKKGVKDSDGNLKLTNVTFSDFAVLCKSRSEMEELKRTFSKCGIPFNHYKEANLFNGKECLDWLALFRAIMAEDFTSSNRKILNECLYSSFFGIKLNEVESSDFDLPDCPQRQLLLQWKKIAKEQKWALLQEQIFEKSGVEERLSKLDKLSSLTKLRQLGDYSIEYLYKNNCSLEELIDYLSLVSKEISAVDKEDGNLVEKGTDFNAVQIMTVHASKGLEFPVVIAAAGIKVPANFSDGFYSYHDADSKLHICCDKAFDMGIMTAGDKASEEKKLEWRRIFYVAYTRASSIMIMPWYANVKKNNTFAFLNNAFEKSAANTDTYLRKILCNDDFDYNDARNNVREILNHIVETNTETETEESWKNKLSKLSSELRTLDVNKFSYSNLSHGQKTEHYVNQNNPEINQNGDSSLKDDTSSFDIASRNVSGKYDESNLTRIIETYPRGNLLGEAVHQTLEMAEFYRIGNLGVADAENDKKLHMLVKAKFRGQGINIDEADSKQILNQTCKIIWSTLNAKLPEIAGSNATGNEFSLKELKDDEHFAELEFNMNPEIPHNAKVLRDYFNGFIDLLFVRNVNGQKRYSVLDWKTDSMEPTDYANGEVLKNHTDKCYSIQRVLYSYCLIKWLKQFNVGKSEQEIFEQYFGGIYYVYVRGTNAGSENGVYAQTWNNWNELKSAFDKIVSEKLPEAN